MQMIAFTKKKVKRIAEVSSMAAAAIPWVQQRYSPLSVLRQHSVCFPIYSSRKIETITGIKPTLYSAPYGVYDGSLITAIECMGIKPVQWDVEPLDTDRKPLHETIQHVERFCFIMFFLTDQVALINLTSSVAISLIKVLLSQIQS